MSTRVATHQVAANALLEAKAIDLSAVATIIGKHADEALKQGDELALVIGKHNFLACGWPVNLVQERLGTQVGSEG